jgi:hypothetical protein
MSRHEITNDKGTWAFGWDQPLLSFYLQLYDGDVEPDDNPVIWLGATQRTRMYEVDTLVRNARTNGLDIPYSMQVTLYGDKDDGR